MIGSGNGLLPEGTKSLTKPLLTIISDVSYDAQEIVIHTPVGLNSLRSHRIIGRWIPIKTDL